MISQRTVAGLAAAKARGRKLGSSVSQLAAKNAAAAAARDAELEPVLRELSHLSGRRCCRDRAPWPRQGVVQDHRARSRSSRAGGLIDDTLATLARVRRGVPRSADPTAARLRQPLNGEHRRQSLSRPSTICR